MSNEKTRYTIDVQVSHALALESETPEAAAEEAARTVGGGIHNIVVYEDRTGAEVYRKYE